MKVHRFYYLLLGILMGVIVFYNIENVHHMIQPIGTNLLYIIFLIFGIGFIQVIAMTKFYTEEERKTKEINGDINTFQGLVQWDIYFPIKINSEMSLSNRISGYVYTIARAIIFIAISYTGFSITCLYL